MKNAIKREQSQAHMNSAERSISRAAKEIKRIVLTGGPCAGKTTALVKVIEYFTNLGYKVFTIPEVPTMFTQAGMDYLTQNHDFFYEGEKATLEIQLALEDKFMRMAETCTEPCVIVCDRGVMDISAYMRPEMWTDITSRLGTNSEELRNRYDAVLHLVSAADGAEQFYTTSNNAQRLEQADEAGLRVARELDKKVIRAWTGHPHLRVINNNVDFERKLNRVIKEIAKVLELPQLIETERKYMPWRSYDGNEFLEGGGFWMQKQHIFLYPFYYIDYALAQLDAFALYRKQLQGGDAWGSYLKLCGMGGMYGYFETLERAGLPIPLNPDTVREIAAFAEKHAEELKAKLA